MGGINPGEILLKPQDLVKKIMPVITVYSLLMLTAMVSSIFYMLTVVTNAVPGLIREAVLLKRVILLFRLLTVPGLLTVAGIAVCA